MRIEEISIISFGKLTELTLKPSEGLGVIYGGNESGKSTLLAFIKFVLYGVGRKNPNVSVGERERAISWSSGSAAGSLTVRTEGGERFRIERSGREGARGAYVDKARIIDLETGAEVFGGEVPGEHFLGIGAQAFDSICSVKQLECVALNRDAVREVIDNLLASGDENTSISAAEKALDAERRRLLHTNGRGGAIYDSELKLERLRSEHRGAVAFENELVKNSDELDRVAVSLASASEDHALAERLCDLYEDAGRLKKFGTLREVEARLESLKKERVTLDGSAGFDVSLASYESAAEMKSALDNLAEARASAASAKAEAESAQLALETVDSEGESEIGELIRDLGSPEGIVSFINKKKSVRDSSRFLSIALGAAGGALLIVALLLAVLQGNLAGALTVAFIGAIPAALSFVLNKRYKGAEGELNEIYSRIGSDTADEDELLELLRLSSEKSILRSRRSNAHQSATIRLSMASDELESRRGAVLAILSRFEVPTTLDGEEASLASLISRVSSYLSASSELERRTAEDEALRRNLSAELALFDERALRARITPEIEERLGGADAERLRADRDTALKRLNSLNQYKAAVERNLASGGKRRSAAEIFPEIEAEEERLASLRRRLDAVRLATETLQSASAGLKKSITPKIRAAAERYLSEMTDGKYSELYIDPAMNLTYLSDGAVRNISSLSRGSLDTAYFAVRLALTETLLGDIRPPLFMDECLSQLDDSRAAGTLRAISERASRGSQCLLFTCQRRDVELARTICPEVEVIEL